jgi:hypothetical protein
MKTFVWQSIVTVTILLAQSCATSSVTYKKTKTVASKAGQVSKRSLAPSVAESYDLSGLDDDSDEYIKRRGNKARGTHDF